MTDTSEIREEMAATRARMADDVAELKDHVTAPLGSAKQRLNVAQLVREHPWPALGAAVVLGAVIGGSGSDEKAATAAATGVKRAARASKEAATEAIQKLRAEDHAEAADAEPNKPGLGERLGAVLSIAVARGLDRVLEEMRVSSRAWGQRMSGAQEATVPIVAATTTVVAARDEVPAPSAADAVPVPNEMLPTEVGARAEAVEALGGGTHEPPLAPGAGELGARWA